MNRKDEHGNTIINTIHYGRELGEQYMVGQYLKSDLSILNYTKNYQYELRAEVYSSNLDSMKSYVRSINEVRKNVIYLHLSL